MHALEIFKARCLIEGMPAEAIGESPCHCPCGLRGGYLSVRGTRVLHLPWSSACGRARASHPFVAQPLYVLKGNNDPPCRVLWDRLQRRRAGVINIKQGEKAAASGSKV